MRRDPTDRTSRLGVIAVARIVEGELSWIFREQHTSDLGIDAHIELVQDAESLGRLIALQIKSGDSYFGEPTTDAFTFRGERKHLEYWLNHSLPVIVVLVNDAGEAFWQHVTADRVDLTEKGWKIAIPRAQRLTHTAASDLAQIAWGRPPHRSTMPVDSDNLRPTFRERAQTLLAKLNNTESLTACLVDAYVLGAEAGNRELADFCHREIVGYRMDESVPEYRRLPAFFSDYQLNASMIGLTNATDALQMMMRRTDVFTPGTVAFSSPLSEAESLAARFTTSKHVLQFTEPYEDSPSGNLHMYVDRQAIPHLLMRVRSRLTQLLFAAMSQRD